MTVGVFDEYMNEAWPFAYQGEMRVDMLCGGTPLDPKVAASWIRAKVKDTRSDHEVAELIAETMAELKVNEEQAIETVAAGGKLAGANGFKSDGYGLMLEGRHLKAAMREAVSVAVNEGKITVDKWGNPKNQDGKINASYKKQIKGWFPEHVFVDETKLYIYRNGQHVTEPDGTEQKFIHSPMGNSIGYVQYVTGAEINFTITTDHLFADREWAMIWLTGGRQGIGADRSQGRGVYEMVKWERIR